MSEDEVGAKALRMAEFEEYQDLADLDPKNTREYLMYMWPAQKLILKNQEKFVAFQGDCEKRFAKLENSFTVGGMIVVVSLFGLALKALFGG